MPICRLFLVLCLFLANWSASASACPFCSAVSQTLSQEIAEADVVVIAQLVNLPVEADPNSDDPAGLDLDDPDMGIAEFEVVEAIRGDNPPVAGSTIEVVFFGSNEQKKSFLISGIAGSQIDWTTSLPLTNRGIEYVRQLGSLPEKGAERLAFFLNHLEDEDPLLAQDAYDEFGRAPYADVVEVGDQMNRQKLIRWIEDCQVGPTRRRLYLTMLGTCGQAEDIAILESLLLYDDQQFKPGIAVSLAMMSNTGPAFGASVLNEMVKADVSRKQQCLDALIAAYLKLRGPDGLQLIEERFLTNPAAEYAHVYAAMMALRFHGEETDSLPRQRLLQSIRLLLDNEEIADQVIRDLARWEDWSVMDKLVEMFKASEEDAWVRQPVISYLLAATEQHNEISERASAALADLEQLDPQAVKRARSYMAFGLLARVSGKKRTEKSASTEVEPVKDLDKQDRTGAADVATASKPLVEDAQPVAPQPTAAEQSSLTPQPGISRLLIIGGPLITGVFLFGIFALLLRGANVRSSQNDS
ncbi:hypothetical protein [Adhaeretor mobilis]|uniref:HEAT repeat domain-containing protein n=1 Tax=Adhaeretor mobilis TaxID=1930276 RepID=A0A517MVD3_9BACT|nr:hypothetical protein [Adhaeretor mobilis]QDS98838.1 hypothetical protein HG15A2_21230 [Adhaeretor mobilis]